VQFYGCELCYLYAIFNHSAVHVPSAVVLVACILTYFGSSLFVNVMNGN
jgi:hypothetical protein